MRRRPDSARQDRHDRRDQHDQCDWRDQRDWREDESFYAFGARACEALVEARRARRLWLVENFETHPRLAALADLAARHGVKIEICSAAELEQIAPDHRGAVALADPPALSWDDLAKSCENFAPAAPPIFIALDGVTDPRNLGAVLRCARAFGAAAIVAPRRRSAPLSPSAQKAAAGAAAFVPICRPPNLARALADLRARGAWIVGADERGDGFSPRAEPPPKTPLCLVFGDEGGGLRRLTREHCDAIVRAPTVAGDAGCLNVAVACGVLLSRFATATES